MFNKDKKTKQPKKLTPKQTGEDTSNFDVHVMPAKFLGFQGDSKYKSGYIATDRKPGSSIKKNIILGLGLVVVLGALMLVAAWLFLKSIDKQLDKQVATQKPSATEQPSKLSTTPPVEPQRPTVTDEIDQQDQVDDTFQPIDMSSWTTYNDDQAMLTIKYPPALDFKPLKFTESFMFSDAGRVLGVGRLNINELDYTEKNLKETTLRDRQVLEEQGLFGAIFDSPLKDSQKVIKVAGKNIKIFMILQREDEPVVFERKAVFYNGNYQIVIALQGDQQTMMESIPDYFTDQEWNLAGEYTQENFYKLLTQGKAAPLVQEWYDLFDQIISSLVIVEQAPGDDTAEDVQDTDVPLKEAPPMSQDSDGDKLTDVEEEIYSSDPDKPDTDEDGYLDGDEVLNLYSPIKVKQTLEASGLVEAYPNTQYGYIIYYPSMWSKEELDAQGETVMFTSETTEFVEVIVQENMSGITNIRAWYLSQMAGIEPSRVANIIINGLVGVRSPDSMNVYFMKDNLIYTISYNINLKEEANFITTFEMMIKSFKLFENPLDQQIIN